MTLKERMAMASQAQEPIDPRAIANQSNPSPQQPVILATLRSEHLGRQDGTEPLPMDWPEDEAANCKGNELIVVQNPHLESFLAIKRPGKHPLYLLGPFDTINIPF